MPVSASRVRDGGVCGGEGGGESGVSMGRAGIAEVVKDFACGVKTAAAAALEGSRVELGHAETAAPCALLCVEEVSGDGETCVRELAEESVALARRAGGPRQIMADACGAGEAGPELGRQTEERIGVDGAFAEGEGALAEGAGDLGAGEIGDPVDRYGETVIARSKGGGTCRGGSENSRAFEAASSDTQRAFADTEGLRGVPGGGFDACCGHADALQALEARIGHAEAEASGREKFVRMAVVAGDGERAVGPSADGEEEASGLAPRVPREPQPGITVSGEDGLFGGVTGAQGDTVGIETRAQGGGGFPRGTGREQGTALDAGFDATLRPPCFRGAAGHAHKQPREGVDRLAHGGKKGTGVVSGPSQHNRVIAEALHPRERRGLALVDGDPLTGRGGPRRERGNDPGEPAANDGERTRAGIFGIAFRLHCPTVTAMARYWLMKSEPDTFSFDDLKAKKRTLWDGVRNYQARNLMRDEMGKGDRVLFYHSSCAEPGVQGLARVSSARAVPDPTQFDPASDYHDPKATEAEPRWFCVEVAYDRPFRTAVTLADIKACEALETMLVRKRGQRLSIQPVDKAHFDRICSMGGL